MNIVQSLKTKAAAAGTNLTEVCRVAGISRQTVERWKDEEPKTLQIIRKLEATIETLKKKNARPLEGFSKL